MCNFCNQAHALPFHLQSQPPYLVRDCCRIKHWHCTLHAPRTIPTPYPCLQSQPPYLVRDCCRAKYAAGVPEATCNVCLPQGECSSDFLSLPL